MAGLALRLQQSLEAAAIAYSAGLGTLQTLAWRPQLPSADTATFAMAGLPLVLPPCVWSPSLSPTCARMPQDAPQAGAPVSATLPGDCAKVPCSPVTSRSVGFSFLPGQNRW